MYCRRELRDLLNLHPGGPRHPVEEALDGPISTLIHLKPSKRPADHLSYPILKGTSMCFMHERCRVKQLNIYTPYDDVIH